MEEDKRTEEDIVMDDAQSEEEQTDNQSENAEDDVIVSADKMEIVSWSLIQWLLERTIADMRLFHRSLVQRVTKLQWPFVSRKKITLLATRFDTWLTKSMYGYEICTTSY